MKDLLNLLNKLKRDDPKEYMKLQREILKEALSNREIRKLFYGELAKDEEFIADITKEVGFRLDRRSLIGDAAKGAAFALGLSAFAGAASGRTIITDDFTTKVGVADYYLPQVLPVSAIVFKKDSKVLALDAFGKVISKGQAGVDDASVIQSAVNNGKTVVFIGEFKVNTPIELPQGVNLISRNATILCDVDSALGVPNAVIVCGGDDVIENIHFVKDSIHTVRTIFLNTSSNITVRNCKFTGVDYGVTCWGETSYNISVLNSDFETNLVSIELNPVKKARIENCYFKDTWAIDISGSNDAQTPSENIVINNIIIENGGFLNAENTAKNVEASNIVVYRDSSNPNYVLYYFGELDLSNATFVNCYSDIRAGLHFMGYAYINGAPVRGGEISLNNVHLINSTINLAGNYARVTNCLIKDTPPGKIALAAGKYTIINATKFGNTGGEAIYTSATTEELIISNCIFKDAQNRCVSVRPYTGTLIKNVKIVNSIFLNCATGYPIYPIALDTGAGGSIRKVEIEGCTFYADSPQGVAIWQTGDVRDVIIAHCRFYNYNGATYWTQTKLIDNEGTIGLMKNYGTATISADGATTQFTIAHGLVDTPTYVNVRPKAGAPAPDSIDADATNIILTFSTAPAQGTYYYWWEAKV